MTRRTCHPLTWADRRWLLRGPSHVQFPVAGAAPSPQAAASSDRDIWVSVIRTPLFPVSTPFHLAEKIVSSLPHLCQPTQLGQMVPGQNRAAGGGRRLWGLSDPSQRELEHLQRWRRIAVGAGPFQPCPSGPVHPQARSRVCGGQVALASRPAPLRPVYRALGSHFP